MPISETYRTLKAIALSEFADPFVRHKLWGKLPDQEREEA